MLGIPIRRGMAQQNIEVHAKEVHWGHSGKKNKKQNKNKDSRVTGKYL